MGGGVCLNSYKYQRGTPVTGLSPGDSTGFLFIGAQRPLLVQMENPEMQFSEAQLRNFTLLKSLKIFNEKKIPTLLVLNTPIKINQLYSIREWKELNST